MPFHHTGIYNFLCYSYVRVSFFSQGAVIDAFTRAAFSVHLFNESQETRTFKTYEHIFMYCIFTLLYVFLRQYSQDFSIFSHF